MHLSEITERGSAFNDFANQFCLKPFCMVISFKNGGKRTTDYLDVRVNMSSKWLVQIWISFLP